MAMKIQPMVTTAHLVAVKFTQSQLVTPRDATMITLKRIPRIAILTSNARAWRSSCAHILPKSTMLKVCATIATTNMGETAMPMLALIQIDLCMPKANAKIAI
jgi:hypothetical protein